MDLIKQTVHMEREYPKASSQFVVEEDLIIPDQKADIYKVLLNKSDILQDEIRVLDNHIVFKGKLNYCILYKTDTQPAGLSSLTGSIALEEQLFMDGLQNNDSVNASVALEDFEVTIINSRKLNLHALLHLSAVKTELYDEEIASGLETDEVIETHKENRELLELSVLKKDICRIKEEIELPKSYPNIAQTLWKRISLGEVDIKPAEDTLQIKSNISVFLLYIGEGEDAPIRFYETSIPYQCTLECNNSTASMIPRISYHVSHSEAEVRPDFDGEERIIGIDMVLDLSIRLFTETTLPVLCDIYGTQHDYHAVTKEAKTMRLCVNNSSQYTLNEKVSLAEDAPAVMQLCYSNGFLKLDDPKIVENGIEMCGVLQIQILYVTQEDAAPYASFTKDIPFSYVIEAPQITADSVFTIDNCLDQLNINMVNGTEMEIRAVISFKTFVYEIAGCSLITDVEMNEIDPLKLNALPSVIVYFVKEGDSLWKIGQQYYVTVASIMEQNNLSCDVIHPGDKLFIVK